MRLRWSTWNLWAIGPAWVERTGLAAQVLEPLELDVICLQEVRRQADRDAGKALADDLGMHLGRAEPVAADWWSRRVGEPIAVDNVVLSTMADRRRLRPGTPVHLGLHRATQRTPRPYRRSPAAPTGLDTAQLVAARVGAQGRPGPRPRS